MKGKRFIVIMAIFLMLCSIQATTAFENNNLNQTDAIIVDNVQFSDIVEDSSNEQISDIGGPNNLTGDVANVELSHFVDTSSGISIGSSNIVGVNSQNILGISSENLLEIGNEDKLGITAGTFIYGVDYDQSRVGDDEIPLDRFFKAIFWGIRDYMKNNPSATREWDVFLNNKTFSSNYGSGAIETGYSLYGDRVRYLALNGLGGYNGAENVALTIHLYGGATKDDGLTSTLDLSGYSAKYALLDFGTGNSTITGVNFKNFDVNKQASTRDPYTTVPFIILGDASDSAENRIQNCTFENIILNPRQPLYQNGNLTGEYDIIKDYYNNQKYLYNDDPVEFVDLVKGIFYGVTSSIHSKNPITTWNVYLHNKTYIGLYDTSNMIETGLNDWANPFPAHYITFKGYNGLNITVHLYGGCTPTDNKRSTIDLSGYGVGYKLIDFSIGDSSITGVNFVNYNRYDHDESKMSNRDKMNDALINLGTYRNPTYQSSLINCTFENITLGDTNMIVRMAFKSNPLNSSEKIMSGGKVENCTFINNNASQMLVIGGAVIDSAHSDECPVFYGFNATNNKFINNVGRAKYDSTLMSLGLAFKLWNEAVNVTLHNNVFINNTNAVHGAAYCIIGTNVTITNNYVEANQAVYGAGIEAHNGNITIKDSIFVNNVASGNHSQHSYRDGSGAAIALLGSNNYIYNCTFTNNTAYGHAGAIDIVGGIKKDANGTEYYLIANNTVIKDSNFFDNIAFDYAGAVHINGTNTMMDNTTFEHNNASFAGGVRLIGENVTIVNSTFNDNNAIQGGACYVEGENANILDSIFNFNNATHNNY